MLSTPASGAAHVELPVGEMTETPGKVRIALALNARTRGQAQTAVERLDGVAAEYFWVPTTVDDAGEQLVLEYALEEQASMPFSVAQPRWRSRLASHLPELIGMAVYLESCVRVLEKIELPAMIAPAYLRYTPNSGARSFGAWRLMVVPLVDVTLADWARSSIDAWAWVSSPTLLGKPAPHAGAYAIGAALYTALVGTALPDLPTCERFRRVLRGHVGARGPLEQAIRAALPQSFASEAAALCELILGLLEPTPPRDWTARVHQVGEQLAAYRTAVRWEYEGEIAIARGILERHAATSPHEHVPWDVLSRLRGRDRDPSGALDAAISALGTGDGEAVRELAAQVRRIAAEPDADPARREMIERAVAAADRHGGKLGDLGRLHFAHIEARYLQRWDDATNRLAALASTPWDNVLRSTILARVHAARSEWAHVAKLCKAARLVTQAMPTSGGALGTYVVAYLDHLDGIAHFGAVGVYSDPLYLADAFTRFVASLDATLKVCATDDPLVDANVHWLSWIGAMAHQMKAPDAGTIRTGVEAYLAAQGLATRISDHQRREVPAVVWYDASRLLALSGAP